MKIPRVSINLCCYNSERFLAETLKSIENQTFKDWELVVVNDGSSDSTELMVMEFKDRGFPVVYLYQENKGLGYSRNVALSLSRGDYVAFIDHDDMWAPGKLQKQVEMLDNMPDIDFCYSNYNILSGQIRRNVFFKKKQPEGAVFGEFLHRYPVAVLTVMVRKKAVLGLASLFNENYHLSEEYDLFMRLLYKSKAQYIHEPLACYRIHREMGSLKFIDQWPVEMEQIISTLKKLSPTAEDEYEEEFKYLQAKIGYYHARAEMAKANNKEARRYLQPYWHTDHQFLVLYFITFLPIFVWNVVHAYLARGAFGRIS
jgi:glycosyltransferase involved in cell wall biosynthesis